MKCLSLAIAAVLAGLVLPDACRAQLFSSYQHYGNTPNWYEGPNCMPDPRLGYCLENDCCGHCGNRNLGYAGQTPGQPPVQRSRFVVERGGQRVLTYVGTYEGFQQRYPQYAAKLQRAPQPPLPGEAEAAGPLRSAVRQPVLPPVANEPRLADPASEPLPPGQPAPGEQAPTNTLPEPNEGQSSPSDVPQDQPPTGNG
jgi:hypothetical protein